MGYAAYAKEDDRLDRVVDDIIAAAGGDARAAILDLVRRQHDLECRMDRSVSAGYVRRRSREPSR